MFKVNKYLAVGIGLLIAVALLIFGKGEGHEGVSLATVAVALTEAEKTGFTEPEQKMLLAVKKMVVQIKDQVENGAISKEMLTNAVNGMKDALTTTEIKALKEELEALDKIAKAQGTSLATLQAKLNTEETGTKSIGAVLEDNVEELKKVYLQGSGTKTFMIQTNHKGELVMKPFDTTKAAGPHASIANVGGAGNTASIAQSIDAATLLRLGGNSQIISQYRNSPWIFDLCNLQNAGFDMPFAMWYEEQAKQGASATVTEGGSKPLSQYAYTLKTATYKKEATLVGFTEEFSLDFGRLQDDIMNKGKIDVVNRINTAVLANIIAAATAYNSGTAYKNGAVIPTTNYNDYITLDALAAQVDNNTFGAIANAAVMSTYKKHRIGITMDSQGNFLSMPQFLSGLAMVGNPAMGTDDVLVGDFKQYNIILRGGMIVKVGYNGTDFAENRFSVVMEQYYYDYISAIRAAGIVKGSTFAAVKTAITT